MGGSKGPKTGAGTLLVVALVASVVIGPAAAGTVGEEETSTTERTCLSGTEVGGGLCVEVTVTADVSCSWTSGTEAACLGDADWSYQATSLALPGESKWVGSARMDFCPPGELCRGVGVGFPQTSCSWEALSEGCSDAFTYELDTSDWALGPGECLEPTLSVWAWAKAYTPDEATMGPVVSPETDATAEADEQICG